MRQGARRSRKVVSLRGAAIALPQQNREVIETLQSLLEDARGGQLIGLSFAGASPTGHIRTGWAGNAEQHVMLAATTILFNLVLKEF